ncbi:MAG: hypothetical protein SFV23_26005 [Planctomycetaceae bacterium]|nr:hypothetical protein [Planctomycetaceae bacterium]
MLDVKTAIKTAMRFVGEVFEDQPIADLRLEEVEFDESTDQWGVTVSFLRASGKNAVEIALGEEVPREYKRVWLVAATGNVTSLKNWSADVRVGA